MFQIFPVFHFWDLAQPAILLCKKTADKSTTGISLNAVKYPEYAPDHFQRLKNIEQV